jgi:TolB-like protein
MSISPDRKMGSRMTAKPINRSAKLMGFCVVTLALSFFCVSNPTGRAEEAFDTQLAEISRKIAEAVNKANLKAITIAGFTDLRGNESELGLFLSDQLSARLSLALKNCAVVDRNHINKILAEQKLTSSGLVDPENAKKLGQFAGVDAIVIGTFTPLRGQIRITVRVLATDSAKILAAELEDIPKTASIRQVMGDIETEPTPEPTPAPRVVRGELVHPQATPILTPKPSSAPPRLSADSLRSFICSYIKDGEAIDGQKQARYLKNCLIQFYAHRNFTRLQALADINSYHARWPHRNYTPLPESVTIQELSNNSYYVQATFDWSVENTFLQSNGRSTLESTIDLNPDGNPRIAMIRTK